MERCQKCDLYKTATNQVTPRGSDTPLIYFVGEAPGQTEDKEGKPFVGRSGAYLDKVLASLDIKDKVRVFNPVRCIPLNEHGKIRQPTVDEVTACESHLIDDINNTNPKIIVSLGAVPALYFLKEKYSRITDDRGKIYDIEVGGKSYKYLPTLHPAYLLRKSGDLALASNFESDIYSAFQYTNSDSSHNLTRMEEKVVEKAFNFNQFKDFYYKHLHLEEKLAFDIETNSLEPFSVSSRIIGFSLAKKDVGVYVCFDSLEYKMADNEIEQCNELLLSALKSKQLVVHNSIFERSYVVAKLGYELPIDRLDDTLMKARLMLGGHVSSKLKFQCVNTLGYPNWDKDLDIFRSSVEVISVKLRMARNKVYREIFNTSGLFGLKESVLSQEFANPKADNKVNYELKLPLLKLIKAIESYYPEEEKQNIVLDKTVELIKNCISGKQKEVSFNFVPERILSTYGAIDSIATFDLDLYFNKRMSLESTANVNLFEGYKIYLEHAFLGYTFEKNGTFWNEDVAKKAEKDLTKRAVWSLKNMILSPVIKQHLINKLLFDYLPSILISSYQSQLSYQGISIIQDLYKEKPVLKVYDVAEGKKHHIKHLNKMFNIPPEMEEEIAEKVYEMIVEDVGNTNTIDDLKRYYNPNASTAEARDILKVCLYSSDLVVAMFIKNIIGITRFRGFSLSKVRANNDRKLFELAMDVTDSVKETDSHKPDYDESRILFNKFKDIKNNNPLSCDSIQIAFGKAISYSLPSVDDPVIIELYNLFRLTGVDPDNTNTWNDNFKWLVEFRNFKKVFKLLTTYINGSVGRESVRVVNKNDLQSGKDVVLREKAFISPDYELREDEEYLLDTSFGVNTAETGRWRSSMHVLPSASKKYYSSRFTGGTILQPDYSQMEVRVLAYVSKETNMLEAFKRGEDIHRFNAQQIYGKKDVSESERKFAKGATFSIVYGAAEYSFAEEYCEGNQAMASKIFKSFFSTFPKVEQYINTKHLEADEFGKVSLLTNRFVTIKKPSNTSDKKIDPDKYKRQAQNFPIQGIASDVVGSVFFNVCQYLIENNYKSKPFLFTHDSDEIDSHPFELINLISTMGSMLNELPVSRFGIPCQADITLGKSLGHELVVSNFKCNKEFNVGTMNLKGYKDDLYETIENWKDVYSFVGIFDESWKKDFISIGENFQPKRAFNIHAGTEREKGTALIKIKY